MAYSADILKDRVTIRNRVKAVAGAYGLDSAGIEFEDAATVWANVETTKGKRAMNAGSLDVYGVIMVRMRWNAIVNKRSRIMFEGEEYAVLGDTFHANRREDTIQFLAQAPSVQ